MKQSTFSAVMATILKNLWQRYSQSLRLLLVMFLTLTASTAWGIEYSYTFTAKQFSANGSKTLNSVSWTLAGNGGYWGYDGTKGQQFGSGSAPYKTLTLSTSGISGTITKIIINTSGASSVNASFTVSVGGTQWGSSTKLTTSATAYTFTGSNSGEIKFSYTQTSSKALYIKSISVIYETAAATVPVTGVSLNKSTLTLTEGDSETLTATITPANATDKTVTWSTSDANIATVSNGKVTAVAEGTATITVKTKDGNKTATCNVTVNPKPKYTVTLVPGSGSVPSTTLTETSAGAGVTLTTPTLTGCGEWTFAGWAEASVDTKTTEEPTLIPAGAYPLTSDITLYAVYQRTEEMEGNGGGTEVTKSVSISNYATANSWANATKYTTVTIDENITATASTGTNTGKYYESGTDWRFYQTESPKLTISAAIGCTIKTVKVTYSVDKTGVLTYGGTNVSSGTATTINATSATFGVGNTGDATNGQVRITAIEVTYTTSGGGSTTTTYYHSTPECGTPCTDAVNVTKGISSNGSFTMVSGYQSTCNGTVTVTLSNIEPATGYQFSEITQSGVDAAKVTINNTAKTVTYAQNTSGTSIINVTFIEIPPTYTVTWMVNGEMITPTIDLMFTTNITSGNQITLLPPPPAAPAGCSGKVFVGWTTEAIDSETDTPPQSYIRLAASSPLLLKM